LLGCSEFGIRKNARGKVVFERAPAGADNDEVHGVLGHYVVVEEEERRRGGGGGGGGDVRRGGGAGEGVPCRRGWVDRVYRTGVVAD
jgi:hypothetical protein